jgi:phosphonate transport system substrate-binding protein
MKRLLAPLLLVAAGCQLPVEVSLIAAATPTASPTAAPTSIPPTPVAPLGSADNPLVVALPPSTRPQGIVLSAGETLISLLEKNTGYDFVSVIPPSESELIRGLASGRADVATLSPFGYLLTSEAGDAEAAFAREQDGTIFYGAEFVAPAAAAYLTYFDAIEGANTAEANVALAQFASKKPCWTDRFSPSGYVVPLGMLNDAGVSTRDPAFLSGHPAVVRALYAGGICDFGAAYVGAIDYPGLEDELPDVMQRIEVVWRIPAIIPYETMVFSRRMPVEMRRLLTRTFVDLMGTAEGRSAIQTLYGFSAMQVVNDGQYEAFRDAAQASGLALPTLLEP